LYDHRRMARGGPELLKVSLRPIMPDPSTPCGGRPLKWPYSLSGVVYPQSGRPAAIFYPLEHPKPYAYVYISRHSDSLVGAAPLGRRKATRVDFSAPSCSARYCEMIPSLHQERISWDVRAGGGHGPQTFVRSL
jgi:hypothetical protein